MTLGRRRRAATTWYLQVRSDGLVDVLKRGRPVGSEMTPAAAKAYIRRHLRPGDRGYQVEPDGYRTRL